MQKFIESTNFVGSVLNNDKFNDKILTEANKILIKNNSDLVFICDNQTNIMHVNSAFKKLTGYNPAKFIGKSFAPLFDKDNLKIAMQNYEKTLNGESSNYTLTFKDSKVICEFDSLPLRNSHKKIIGVVEIAKNVTYKQKLGEQLKHSEEKYKNVFDRVPISIIVLDKEGDITHVNDYHLSSVLKGRINKEDLIGKNAITYPPNVNAGLSDKIAGILVGKPFELKDVYFSNTTIGTKGYFNIKGIPLYEDGIVKGAITIQEDVTERKKAENHIKSSRDELKNITDSSTELIIAIDKNGIITSWNKALENKTGYKEKDMLSKNIFLDVSSKLQPFANQFGLTIKNKRNDTSEFEIMDKKENALSIFSKTTITYNENGNIDRVILIARDMSDKIQVQEKLNFGNSYLSTDRSLEDLISMIDILNNDILIISRGNISIIKQKLSKNASFLLMSNKNSVTSTAIMNNILKDVKKFISKNENSIILLDKISYLSSLGGFSKFQSFLYEINDLVVDYNAIAIFYVNQDSFDKKEFSILKDELKDLPKLEEAINIKDRKLDLLKYINSRNLARLNINYTQMSKEFKVSRMTIYNWLREFLDLALISKIKSGKASNFQVTKEGKKMIDG